MASSQPSAVAAPAAVAPTPVDYENAAITAIPRIAEADAYYMLTDPAYEAKRKPIVSDAAIRANYDHRRALRFQLRRRIVQTATDNPQMNSFSFVGFDDENDHFGKRCRAVGIRLMQRYAREKEGLNRYVGILVEELVRLRKQYEPEQMQAEALRAMEERVSAQKAAAQRKADKKQKQ